MSHFVTIIIRICNRKIQWAGTYSEQEFIFSAKLVERLSGTQKYNYNNYQKTFGQKFMKNKLFKRIMYRYCYKYLNLAIIQVLNNAIKFIAIHLEKSQRRNPVTGILLEIREKCFTNISSYLFLLSNQCLSENPLVTILYLSSAIILY